MRKILKKFQAKTIQGHVPWLNLKKQISVSQYANNFRIPLFRSMRQAQNTNTQTLNECGCPKIVPLRDPISLLINRFEIHLEPECKSHK